MVEDKESKKGTEQWWKIILTIAIATVTVVLIVIAINKENFPIGWLVIGLIIAIIGIAIIWWGSHLYHKIQLKEESGIPKSISLKEAFVIVKQTLEEDDYYMDKIVSKITDRSYPVGKDKVCTIHDFICRGFYHRSKEVHLLINLNYPERNLPMIDPRPIDLKNAINSLGVEPDEKPDIEETTVENLLTGTTSTSKKRSYKKKKKKTDEDNLE